jgi:hypothetical protein
MSNEPLFPASPPPGWECPNCDLTTVTSSPGTPYHPCPGLHGLAAPLVPAGSARRCTVTAEEREDYLGGEVQATGDDGKAYMAVRTTYDDHDDVAVNAGLAHARGRQ